MLKLSRHLFLWEPSGEVADFYERALFNHILASQHPQDGRVIYNLSLEMGGYKSYQDPESFTCCVGTGMENHSKYGRNIYFHNENEIYVSQFIASEVNWATKGVKLKQITKYPEEQHTSLEFEMQNPVVLTLHIRYPYWAESGMKVEVNNRSLKVTQSAGSFIPIRRRWRSGDVVKVNMPFNLRLESMPDDQSRVAIMYGPLVLAGDLGPVEDQDANNKDYVPVLMTENRNPDSWIQAGKEINTFRISGVGNPRDFTLKPFYATHDRRYSVYWDMFNEKEWQARQDEYEAEKARKIKLEKMTYDFLQLGEMQPERNHSFHGENTEVLEHKSRKGRVANRGGSFSFEMKVMKGQPMALVVEYWGGFTGSKTFDILVNDQIIATENISGKADGQFIDVQYTIPDEISLINSRIKVDFIPHSGHRAGPVFNVRTIKR
jgi:hypothetical protein